MRKHISYLGEVGRLASLVLGDLLHRVLGALLAVGPPLFGNVHHLNKNTKQIDMQNDTNTNLKKTRVSTGFATNETRTTTQVTRGKARHRIIYP